MSPDRQLLTTLARLRHQWRLRVVAEAAVWIVGAAALAVLCAWLISQAFAGSRAWPMLARSAGYLLVAVAFMRGLIIPLLRRSSDERFALYVEEREPGLRQSLLAAVQEAHLPASARPSPSLSARVITRAITAIDPIAARTALERPRLLRAGKALAMVSSVSALMLWFGPQSLRDGARLLFVPFGTAQAAVPVLRLAVSPGSVSVPRGGAVEVEATLTGFAASNAELVFRSDSGGEWQRLPMAPDSDSAGFRSRLFDIVQRTEYYVEAADVRSTVFTLVVNDLPAVSRVSLDLRFPSYSGLPTEHIEDTGDVAAVTGTSVTVRARVTRAVSGGFLRFDDGRTVPMTRESDSTVTGTFTVKKSGFYHVDLAPTDGATVAGAVEYVVDAIPDRAPIVRIEEPGRDTKVTNTDEVTVAVQASDDLGVTSLELRYRVNGGEEKRASIGSGSRRPRDARGAHTLFLEEMSLSPGDLVAYHAVARDGAGLVGTSDVYFLEVRPFGKDYRQSDQRAQPQPQGGGGQPQGDSPDGFVARQREVVAGTFNWMRDSAGTSDKQRRENMTTLAIAEGRLREDVEQLSKRLAERGVAAQDSNFAKIRTELRQASVELKVAEEQLGRVRGSDALPPEQRALQRLQRAEAWYRDVQVQMGGGGGSGGGGGQQRAEDLADLFELENDKQRNQYETVQQQRGSDGAEPQMDESLERLRQLARRQQQENERLQRMADAMRQRLAPVGGTAGASSSAGSGGSSTGSGGGRQQGSPNAGNTQSGAQRELARQAEAESRRLERLAREQGDPELQRAAQRLQQAADDMRRAAAGSASQGTAALEELNRAARNLEGARSSGTTRGVQQLADKARELEERQQQIQQGVQRLQSGAGGERSERLQQLNQQKDKLAGDVRQFENEADRLSRTARRDQPKAAGQLSGAADAIREARLADKIEFSKQVARSGSAEYATTFEDQIGENIRDVADRLRAARGALQGESASRGQERTLERTRDLVAGMESLRERVADRAGRPGQQGEREPGQRGQGQQGAVRAGGTPGNQAEPPGGRAGSVPRGDAEQFTREMRLRRQTAEAVRREAAAQGVNTQALDRAIQSMRELENAGAFGDPKGLEQLQSAMLERLKDFEFALYRTVAGSADGRPAVGARATVPAEYRQMVEEYYRSLAGGKRKQ